MLLRGLALSSACFLFACTGTDNSGAEDSGQDSAQETPSSSGEDGSAGDGSSASLGTSGRIDPVSGAMLASGNPSFGMQDPEAGEQDPLDQDPESRENVRDQRRQFLIDDALNNARKALQLGLYERSQAYAGEVLELDPGNSEAQQILDQSFRQDPEAAGRTFQSKVLQERIAAERARFLAQQRAQEGDAKMEAGRFADAVEDYEYALLTLTSSPLSEPGSTVENAIRAKLDAATQQREEAMQSAAAEAEEQARRDLEEQTRRRQQELRQRIQRLMVLANADFQIGRFRSAVALLDQALLLDPNDQAALALHDLASRAKHEQSMSDSRERWQSEWNRTFQDLDHSLLPQSDVIVYDLERWREVTKRQPLQFSAMDAADSPEETAIRRQLDETVIDHSIAGPYTLDDWAAWYADQAKVNFVITESAREVDEETATLTDFRIGTMSVAKALDVIQRTTGVKWVIRDGVVELVGPDEPTGRAYLVPYGVRDIVLGVRNHPGPKLKLTVPGEEDFGDFGFDDEEPAPTVIDDGRLEQLITDNIEPEAWGEFATINYQSGALLVRAPKSIHDKVTQLLADLRRAIGIQVDIEARFLRVEDSFLEDVGVDFRGLGDQSSEGAPGRGLEGDRSNTRFDDFGRPEQINTAVPGEIGSGTEPGIFFNDGEDGDLLGRTENLYDRSLGGGEGELDNSGGLAVQFAFLDDVELEVILRAVQKEERSEEIVAPRLLVYNNTRAHMQALRHTSYIRDFNVEIAQAAAVANPVVDVVNDGVVLDVRPVVSADRRFITMELRPTVMNLQLPISTFTTTLGAGQPVSIQLPDVTLQRVRTTVTMPDGGTILLGGMKMAERQNTVSGVPLLKDIPLLSFLFSRKGTYVLNRKIIILIKASIVMTEEYEPEFLPDSYETLLLAK